MYGLRELVDQVRGAGLAIRIESVPQHARRLFGRLDLGLEEEPQGSGVFVEPQAS
jgi:hypothetical protein